MNRRRTLKLIGTLIAIVSLMVYAVGCTNAGSTVSNPAASAPANESQAPSQNLEPIKIGSLNHVSGAGATWGVPEQNAIELAVEEINAAGGVLGRQIQLIKEDDNTDTDMAVQKAKKLCESDKVEAIFGGVWSSIRAAVLTQVADPNKVPYFYPTYNEGGSTLANCSRYYICTGAIPNQQLKEFIPYLIKNYGTKIYLIGIDEVMTTDSWKYIDDNKLVENAGGTIVGRDVTPWQVGDWSSILQRVKDSGAEVVFPYVGGSEMINFLKQFYDFGLNKTVKLASVYLDETFVSSVPENLRAGILCSASYFQTVDTPENKQFLANYAAKYGSTEGVSQVVEAAYDSVYLWKLAVEKAGVVDKEKMLDALPSVTFNAPEGPIHVNATSQHTALHSLIAECQADGSFKVLVDLGLVEPEAPCDLSNSPTA